MKTQYTYLLIELAVIFFPLVLSFDKKVAFYKTWKALFFSTSIVGAFFIIWDIYFVSEEVWRFNPDYVLGIYLFGLPLEEWLFFVVVPYACVFVYECIRIYFRNYFTLTVTRIISMVIAMINFVFLAMGGDKFYTLINSLICLTALGIIGLYSKWKQLNLFYVVFIVCLIPFTICNGLLTSLPILIYDNAKNLSWRVGSIPAEDFIYNFTMLLLWCYFYEKFRYLNKPHAPINK